MNIHHAAALALVGWYLMIPPAHSSQVRSDAPMTFWTHIDSFDSATECREAGFRWIDRTKMKVGEQSDRYLAAVEFECIGSDDPRLKEK